MIHGPCGADNMFSPCMKEGCCSKFYPKSFAYLTTINTKGHPLYKGRKTGCYIEKGNIALDNCYVLPKEVNFNSYTQFYHDNNHTANGHAWS